MKKTILFTVLLLQFLYPAKAHIFDNLIGADKEYLAKKRDFRCRYNMCVAPERKYFDNPLLDKTVSFIETFSNEKGVVYKIALYISHTLENKNSDIITAFYNTIKKEIKDSKNLKIEFKELNDKYGTKSVIYIIDYKMKQEYIRYFEK